MNKNILLELSKNLNIEYEIGIWSETTDFLERQDNIVDFSVDYEQGHFNIVIELKEFDLPGAKSIFASLVQFIEYKSTFYVREDKKDSCVYHLLSSMDNKKAFLCYIVIK
ncbi:hypothetical protein PTI45_02226 [Paenibacillus nuruki]|uniref:Uncharacterized protein n=1 Tax=Paenibacillus nuruki TaxID=1886670 RepID=A0A1E3L3A8_9BACL|nr:hypothetical protein [Paenibacillus nuruki]ODP28236.1 hypothetical protein PTI45_02226 [Paenibacillus nuruki]